MKKAIEYFEEAIRESDEIIGDCSEELKSELIEQKQHFIKAVNAMRAQEALKESEGYYA